MKSVHIGSCLIKFASNIIKSELFLIELLTKLLRLLVLVFYSERKYTSKIYRRFEHGISIVVIFIVFLPSLIKTKFLNIFS